MCDLLCQRIMCRRKNAGFFLIIGIFIFSFGFISLVGGIRYKTEYVLTSCNVSNYIIEDKCTECSTYSFSVMPPCGTFAYGGIVNFTYLVTESNGNNQTVKEMVGETPGFCDNDLSKIYKYLDTVYPIGHIFPCGYSKENPNIYVIDVSNNFGTALIVIGSILITIGMTLFTICLYLYLRKRSYVQV